MTDCILEALTILPPSLPRLKQDRLH